ncbi:hypothetical protein BD560DRAFT_333282, partial [Blakeslea trispora]
TAQRVHEWERQTRQHLSITHDQIVASPHNLLTNTLGTHEVNPTVLAPNGTILPACYHHVYFPPRTPESELAHDGYETDFFPPAPFSQRMWAGAELSWSQTNPLSIGDQAKMTTQLDTVQLSEGRMGESVKVWINKDIENQHGWCMRERRCLVYHPTQQGLSPTPPLRGIPVRKKPDFSLTMTPSSILLFRYSALTFNSHKIHFDHLYATQIENHPACLVHGPLSGTLLVHALQQQTKVLGPFKQFSYKCLAPLYVNQPLTIAGKQSKDSYELWITNNMGHLAVKGSLLL